MLILEVLLFALCIYFRSRHFLAFTTNAEIFSATNQSVEFKARGNV